MIESIIGSGVKGRFLVLLALMVITVYGVYSYFHLPVDAFPDISPVMVPVFAEVHGMAPEEIERLITFPIEAAMNGLPGVTQIKSTSAFGMAVVYVYFDDNTDMYFARQIVSERLTATMNDLPEMHDPPVLGPISTGLGQIFLYYLTLEEGADTDGKAPDTYLREVNDWIVKFQLQTVKGVTDILSIGGHVLQYQIRVNPNALAKYGVSLEQLVEAVRSNNRNVGGQFLLTGAEEYLVRGLGLLGTLDEIGKIKLKTVEGVPVTIGDIAEVGYGEEIRRGVVTRNGEGEVVSGMVLKLYGENTSHVIEGLYRKVEEVEKNLPEGVALHPYYEQADLVSKATYTVKEALLIGALLVMLTLAVFLGNLRTALIVTLTLPFCALVSVISMQWTGISANIMSLGGIAIAIGILCDGSIVVVENIFRHLNGRETGKDSRDQIIVRAAGEVARPIFFSLIIVVMVFIPILTLQEVEGKMFHPMALTLVFALLGAVIAALIMTPVLSHFLLRRGNLKEFFLLTAMKKAYRPLLEKVLHLRMTVPAAALIVFLCTMVAVPFLGTEFIPTLEEGSILIGVTMAPSTSLEKGTESVLAMEKEIMDFPEVDETVSRIGRPEAGSHPHPVNYAEIHIELKPDEERKGLRSKEEVVEALSEKLNSFPGVQLNFTQPIQNAFDELLSGVKAQIAVKIYGENLSVLRQKSDEITSAIENVPGLVDLSTEQSFGQPQVQIAVDREACSRYGINVDQVLELVELAVGGEVIDTIYPGTRRFGIHVRYKKQYRNDTEAIGNLLVQTTDGSVIPLSQIAKISRTFGPSQISREKNQRRWIVQGNVRGRDLGGTVAEIREQIEKNVELPAGYFVEYDGQFKNQQRAMTRLQIIVPLVILAVFILLYLAFGSIRHSAIIMVNMPLALIGGVLGLVIMGEYLSVPAAVGFIALLGIAVQDSMVLVNCYNQLKAKGKTATEAVTEGSIMRLRPVLMTSVTTILGLLPLLLSTRAGAEVQRPLAAVVIFGMITATALTLFVIPAVYLAVEEKRSERIRRSY